MSAHPIYRPQSPLMQWLEQRLPIGSFAYSSFVVYPTPRNLNYWWTFGGILTFMLGAQIVTGVVLAMHYTPHVDFAFNSVESIMRDVNGAIPDTVPAGAGILVSPNDKVALARALRRVIVEPGERAKLAACACKAASQLPNWRDAAKILAQVIESVA